MNNDISVDRIVYKDISQIFRMVYNDYLNSPGQ